MSPAIDPARPDAPRRRRHGRELLVLAVAVALLLAAALAARWVWSPVAETPPTVSCAPYGLEDLTVVPRGPEDPGGGPGGLRPGGDRGERRNASFAHGGVTSTYHVFADGVDWDEPVGVVFRFHGDGAYEFHNPQHKLSCLAEVARSHNAVLVAARTPDREGVPTWWEASDRNAQWFLALAEQLFADYDLDRSRTWWHGYSGGAEFISYELLADHVQALTGGAVLSGGGGAPAAGTARPTAEQLERLVLHWDVGLDDDGSDPLAPFDALSAARAGHAWYERLGYERVSVRYREGVDHFGLPEARVLDEALAARSY